MNQDSFYYFYPKFILRGWNGTVFPFVQQESVFWRRELLKNFDYDVFSSLRLAGDFFLWHSFSKNGETLYLVNSILSGWRRRDNQLSEALEDYRSEMKFIVKNYTGLNKKDNIITIKPNVIEYSRNKWVIKKYSQIKILGLFNLKWFRKMFKYMFLRDDFMYRN